VSDQRRIRKEKPSSLGRREEQAAANLARGAEEAEAVDRHLKAMADLVRRMSLGQTPSSDEARIIELSDNRPELRQTSEEYVTEFSDSQTMGQ